MIKSIEYLFNPFLLKQVFGNYEMFKGRCLLFQKMNSTGKIIWMQPIQKQSLTLYLTM